MITNKDVKFAVVGQGHIGKRHAEMIRREAGASLVGICDILPKEELNLPVDDAPFYSSFDEMISSGIDADVINICVPNGLHATYATKSLLAGYNVVIEKPIALTTVETKMIKDAAEKSGKRVFCVMQNRYSPPSVWLKETIEQKRLGKIFMVQLCCYWNRDERYYKPGNWHGTADLDGGTLFTQFSHFIDIMYWLFGDIMNIRGNFADFTHQKLTAFEDSGFVSFDFVDGGMGTLCYSSAVWNKNLESSITIIGEKGTIKVAGQYMNEVVYCDIDGYEMPELAPSNPPNDYGPYKGSAQNHHYVIRNVVDTLTHGANPTTTLAEGSKVVEIIEKIYKCRDEHWKKA